MINTYEIYAHVGDSCVHAGESDISVEISSYMMESDEILFTKPVSIFGFEMKRYFVVKNKEKRKKRKERRGGRERRKGGKRERKKKK